MNDRATNIEATEPPPVLELEGVNAPGLEAGDRTRVEAVHWTVRSGEFHVVGGRPGSGRSALLAAAAGLSQIQEGTGRLWGVCWQGLKERDSLALRRKVGLVFADGGRPFHQLNVMENLALALRYHGELTETEMETRVAHLLEVARLRDQAHVIAGRLGRQERPRLALARALALQPEFMLLDDPISGLDSREARWWLNFLAELHRGHAAMGGRPLTLAVTTADLRPWMAEGRHYFWLENHRLHAAGDVHQARCLENPVLRDLLAER